MDNMVERFPIEPKQDKTARWECFHIISTIKNPWTETAEKGLGLGRRFCRLCNILKCATLIIWLLPSRLHTDICISIYLFCFTELSGSHFMLASHSHGLVCKNRILLISNTHENCHSRWQRSNVAASDEESQCQVTFPQKTHQSNREHKIFSPAVKAISDLPWLPHPVSKFLQLYKRYSWVSRHRMTNQHCIFWVAYQSCFFTVCQAWGKKTGRMNTSKLVVSSPMPPYCYFGQKWKVGIATAMEGCISSNLV